MAHLYAVLAQVALDRRDDATAQIMAQQSIQLARSVDSPETISLCLTNLADSAARRGESLWAAQLWGAAERQRDATRVRRLPVEPPERSQLVETVRVSLGARTFTAVWVAGRALTPEEALTASDPHLASARRTATSTPTATRPAGLTRRELEVLLLVAEGCSNVQIARRLVISVATVKTYLSAIYAKIRVRSRTAAMRYVIDQQLH
jgi:DNA-binding CsgD family transcriptional regulator